MSKIQDILIKLPPSLRKKAQIILDAILTSKNAIDWDNELKLVVNNSPILGSNVASLVAHVLYPSWDDPTMQEPTGFNVFLKSLKNIGLEHEYVKNEKAKKVLKANSRNNKCTFNDKYDDDDDEYDDDEDESNDDYDSDDDDYDDDDDDDEYSTEDDDDDGDGDDYDEDDE